MSEQLELDLAFKKKKRKWSVADLLARQEKTAGPTYKGTIEDLPEVFWDKSEFDEEEE